MSCPPITQPYDYTHPEEYFEGLEWYRDTSIDDLRRRDKVVDEEMMGALHTDDPGPVQLCRACGWNTFHETSSGYVPRVKIFHTNGAMGMWSLGSRWILRDEPNDSSLGSDTLTQMFIREHPDLKDIPLPKVMQVLSEPGDQIQLTLMSRCQGTTLASVWHTLDRKQKAGYSRQMAGILKQIRQITAPRMQKVNGEQIPDNLLGKCVRTHYPTCKKIPYTQDEWIKALTPEIRKGIAHKLKTQDPEVIDAKFHELQRRLPADFGPYVLTHGDLNMWNIMVKDDKIEAIIDWELAGFLPWWAERWLSLNSVGHPKMVDQFYIPVWREVSPEMNNATFLSEIMRPLSDFSKAFQWCPHDHINLFSHYLRPKWCECKPYGGELKSIHIGQSFEHRVIEEGDDSPQSWDRSGAFAILAREMFENDPELARQVAEGWQRLVDSGLRRL